MPAGKNSAQTCCERSVQFLTMSITAERNESSISVQMFVYSGNHGAKDRKKEMKSTVL